LLAEVKARGVCVFLCLCVRERVTFTLWMEPFSAAEVNTIVFVCVNGFICIEICKKGVWSCIFESV